MRKYIKMWTRMTIKTRLNLLQVPITLLSVTVSVIAWRALSADTYDSLMAAHGTRLAVEFELVNLKLTDAFEKPIVVGGSTDEQVKEILSVEGDRARILHEFSLVVRSQNVVKRLAEVTAHVEQKLKPIEKQMLQLVRAGRASEIRAMLDQDYLPSRKKCSEMADLLEVYAASDTTVQADRVADMMISSAWVIIFSLFTGNIVLSGGIMFLVKQLDHSLTKIISTLRTSSKDISQATVTVSQTNGTFLQQGEALNETAVSMEEISAMVTKTADGAKVAKELSESSLELAARGNSAVEDLSQSMEQIQKSNSSITEQIKVSNAKISEITELISEVRDKTKVINSIVFQTKLLSFNASIEAALAGDSGKGFAVVAEEMGNLARLSGAAATEIATKLEASTGKIKLIISESTQQVQVMMDIANKKVDEGFDTSKRCAEIFQEILSSVQEVNKMTNQITTASGEQASGLVELNKAMSEITNSTNKNAELSRIAGQASAVLTEKADGLKEAVFAISALTKKNNKTSSVPEQATIPQRHSNAA